MLQTLGSCKVQLDANICGESTTPQVGVLSFSLDDIGVLKLKDDTGAVRWFQLEGSIVNIVESVKVI